MSRLRQILAVWLAVLVPALFTNGCASNALWEKKTYHPSDRPNLSLALDPIQRAVLVQYDEQYEDSRRIRRRAYWLSESDAGAPAYRKPVFVNPKNYAGLTPIPLLDRAPTNAPVVGYVAAATPAQQGFDLWLDGAPVGRHYLPVYVASPPPTVWRVLATPFAALGDTVVVIVVCAAVIAVVAGLAYLETQTHSP